MKISKMIQAIDLHACGEHARVIVGGVLDVPGKTLFDKMRYLETQGDDLRKRMLQEPRGNPAANCNLILPSSHPDADAGFIIMEPVEYPTMSGSNTISVVTAMVETGMVKVTEPVTRVTLEAPAGLITAEVQVKDGKAKSVKIENVPAFPLHLDKEIDVPELGKVTVDVAWGGIAYVITDVEKLGYQITPDNAGELARVGEMIKQAAKEQIKSVHPGDPNMVAEVTLCQLTGTPTAEGAHAKNAVIKSTGQLDWDRPSTWTGVVDRSPCGTGTCARMAVLHAKGQLPLNQPFHHEGILGTIFTGELLREVEVGGVKAVVPTLQGQAWVTSIASYVVDPDDPFPDGFTVGDIWGSELGDPIAH